MKKDALKLDWASHNSAVYACQNWHYSKRIPTSKLSRIGVWERGKFVGVVIFGAGASARIHEQFGVTRYEVCELVRIALKEHETPVSRIVAIAIRLLRRECPGLRVIVSFADPNEGHHGGIYQAGNWVYTGKTDKEYEYFYNGEWRHVTHVYKKLGPAVVKTLPKRKKQAKYRYVMPFDDEIRRRLKPKPYPKRVA